MIRATTSANVSGRYTATGLGMERHDMRSCGGQTGHALTGDNLDANADTDRIAIQVWGTRYIDDAAIRGESTDLTNDGSGLTLEKTRYYATDALFSTVALLDSDGDLLERVRYTAYGEARHWKAADLDGDGDVDDDDKDILWDAWGNSSDIADAAYNADADINRDGTVDGTDDGIRLFSIGPALPAGQISEVDNPIGYAGYVFNAADATYLVRNRCYEPDMGRWLERDPRRYIDGSNIYAYTMANPLVHTDPTGMVSACTICKTAVEAATTSLCGANGALICLQLGVSGPWSTAACGAITSLACLVGSRTSGSPTALCESLGFCGQNAPPPPPPPSGQDRFPNVEECLSAMNCAYGKPAAALEREIEEAGCRGSDELREWLREKVDLLRRQRDCMLCQCAAGNLSGDWDDDIAQNECADLCHPAQ